MENYYSLTDEKIIQARKRAQKLCVEYNEKVNQKNFYDEALLNTLLKKVGRDPYVEPNFRCFLGSRIELGDEVFLKSQSETTSTLRREQASSLNSARKKKNSEGKKYATPNRS